MEIHFQTILHLKEKIMKNLIFILTFTVVFLNSVVAQRDTGRTKSRGPDPEFKTIFKNPPGPVKVGFFVGPEFAYSQFKEKPALLAGVSGGVILDHVFSVGLCGYGIVNSQNLYYNNIKDTMDGYLYGGYGGLRLELIVNPNAPVHFCFPFIIGGGGLNYSSFNYSGNSGHQSGMYPEDYSISHSSFFFIQPGVMVGFNLLNFLRFDTGVSYRYSPNLDLANEKERGMRYRIVFRVHAGLMSAVARIIK
jgi:hypothetical protein